MTSVSPRAQLSIDLENALTRMASVMDDLIGLPAGEPTTEADSIALRTTLGLLVELGSVRIKAQIAAEALAADVRAKGLSIYAPNGDREC